MMTTTTPRNDLLARYAVYGLCALALWAGVRAVERPTESARAQDIILQATATPALPTAVLAPVVGLAPPTLVPVDIVPPSLPTPAWPADMAPVTAQEAPGATEGAGGGDYIANVGAQAAHSPRGDVDDPPPAMQSGPILYPDQNIIIDPNPAPPLPGMAVAVPAISSAQAQILGARQSDTCPAGQVFYPRTGCHLEGSGGPQPGAVGEN